MKNYLVNLSYEDRCLLIGDLCGFAILIMFAIAAITLAP